MRTTRSQAALTDSCILRGIGEDLHHQPSWTTEIPTAQPGHRNLVESPSVGIRLRPRRVTRQRNGQMIPCWAADAYLETESHFRRMMGYESLWVLEAALREEESASLDAEVMTEERERHQVAVPESVKPEPTRLRAGGT